MSSIVSASIQLGQLAVLARILKAEDLGLVAIVYVVVGLSQALADLGLSNAIVHQQSLSKKQLNSLFWLNAISGCIVYAILLGIAPILSAIYRESEFVSLVAILGFSFVLQPIGQFFGSLFQRRLKFSVLSLAEISSRAVQFLVAVILAEQGLGVYSIAWATVVGAGLQALVLVSIGTGIFRPRWELSLGSVRSLLVFGMYQVGERVLNFLSTQIDQLLVGWLLGIRDSGIYYVAKQLVMRPAQIINPVVTKVSFPVMSLMQDDQPRLRSTFLRIVNFLSAINIPIYAGIFLLSQQLVSALFGPNWSEAGAIVQVLAIYAAIRSTMNPIGSLLLAAGRARLGFIWTLGVFAVTPCALIVGGYWGAMGIAWAQVALVGLLVFPHWRFLVLPSSGATFGQYHLPLLKTTATAVFAVLGGHTVNSVVGGGPLGTFLTGVVGVLIVLLLTWWLNKSVFDEIARARR